jgi:hypothetical protein
LNSLIGAKYYGVDLTETDWTQLGKTPHTGRTAADRRKSAGKATAMRKRHELYGDWFWRLTRPNEHDNSTSMVVPYRSENEASLDC